MGRHPQHCTKEESLEQFIREARKRWESYLDEGHEKTYLAHPHCREIIRQALHHFDGKRYKLMSYITMPNHVHLLLQLGTEQTLSSILHSIKSYTSNEINRFLEKSGTLWERECFDRIIRSSRHLEYVRNYIKENPRHCSTGTYTYWQCKE